jgi:tRNA A-37 threonylcarbamoyl transferase component Bud32
MPPRDEDALAASPSQSPTLQAPSGGSDGMVPRARAGETIGDYILQARIAHGGMGEIWEAQDMKLRRTVALKLIRPDKLTGQLVRRFSIESRAQARLQHEGIAQIFQAEMTGPQPFIAMELIRGAQRLDSYVHLHGLSVMERLALFCKITDAVSHAHDQAVLHLDLKPSNILVRADGQPKVLDFGGGHITDEPPPDQWDVAVVTPAYMSPEQAELDRRRVDQRSDVYSLGVIAYELLTGTLPYAVAGKTFSEVREEICGPTRPQEITNLSGAARHEAGVLIRHALEKLPPDRYPSARALHDDVRAILHGTAMSVIPESWWGQLRRWLRNNEHVRWSGHVLSMMAWLHAALCAWFIVVILVPSLRTAVTPDVRAGEFVIHEGLWLLVFVALGFCARRAARGSLAMIWLMVWASAGLTAFTMAVATGLYAYDAAGAVTDPTVRAMVFTVASALALVALVVSGFMVTSYYACLPWRAVPPARTTAAQR